MREQNRKRYVVKICIFELGSCFIIIMGSCSDVLAGQNVKGRDSEWVNEATGMDFGFRILVAAYSSKRVS